MLLWITLAALAALALVLLLAPLLRRPPAAVGRADYDIEVYLDQLGELERDLARGIIGDRDAAAARIEIERRLLAAGRASEAGAAPDPSAGRPNIATSILLAVVIPAAALAIYLQLGSPDLPGKPFAGGPAASENDLAAQAAAALKQAEAAVRSDPGNDRAWHDLGRMRFLSRQWQGAADALAEAVRLAPERADIASSWGEALVYAADGEVSMQARGAFDRALAINPSEPRARFYLALGKLQDGFEADALNAWVSLLRESPSDAPWRPEVEARTRALAEQLGEDIEVLLKAAPREQPRQPATAKQQPHNPEPSTGQAAPGQAGSPKGPNADDLAAANQMPKEQRDTMIRGMVERLATRLETQSDDVEGWRQLGRSWSVLGEHRFASDAYGRALELDPGHPETLFRAALSASNAGDTNAALERFMRLRTLIPPGTDAFTAVNRAIKRIEAKKPGAK